METEAEYIARQSTDSRLYLLSLARLAGIPEAESDKLSKPDLSAALYAAFEPTRRYLDASGRRRLVA